MTLDQRNPYELWLRIPWGCQIQHLTPNWHLAELEHALADDRLGLVWVSVIACHLWCDHKGEEEELVARRSMNRTRAENVTEWSLVLSVGLEQLPTGGQEGRWAGDTIQSTLRTGSGCRVHEGGRRTGTKAEMNILGYIRHAKSRSLTSGHLSTPLLLARRQGTGWQYLGRLRSSPWPIVIQHRTHQMGNSRPMVCGRRRVADLKTRLQMLRHDDEISDGRCHILARI